MADGVLAEYEEIRPQGRRVFVLFDERILVKVDAIGVPKCEITIPFSSVYPEYSKVWMKHPYRNLGLVCFLAGIIIGTLLSAIFEVKFLNVVGIAVFWHIAVVLLFLGRHSIEYAQFRNEQNQVLFDFARSGPQSKEFDEFLIKVQKQARQHTKTHASSTTNGDLKKIA